MAKKTVSLDTPFKRGEKVMLVHPIPGRTEGERGKISLVNGFDEWKRYWVRFADGDLVGSVDHADLVRPRMYPSWRQREEQAASAAQAAAAGSSTAPAAAAVEAGDGGGGVADLIPAALLERSRAAKARLTGG
ncbi:MAG: hypothetical protein HKN03_19035 [Acidimicrobiales bacterium]|nr:hypothetical protein [Acidimicrobiales bacterium]